MLTNLGINVRTDPASFTYITGIVGKDGEVFPETKNKKKVPLPPGLPKESIALRLEIPNHALWGWTLYYNPQIKEMANAINKLCIIEFKDKRWLRIVKLKLRSGVFITTSITSEDMQETEIDVAYPVEWLSAI